MSTKVNNFQEEFTIHDIKVARDVKATYNCGMSRIALKAPNQIYRIHKRLMQEPDSASLFYLYDNEMVMEKAVWHPSREPKENEVQLCREGTPICIK